MLKIAKSLDIDNTKIDNFTFADKLFCFYLTTLSFIFKKVMRDQFYITDSKQKSDINQVVSS